MQVVVDEDVSWIIDSGCSTHMTEKIIFGGGSKGRIKGLRKIKLSDFIEVEDVNFVENLFFSLLSVSQLCNKGRNKIVFYIDEVKVKNIKTKEVLLRGIRHNNIYKVDPSWNPYSELSLAKTQDNTHLWHKRVGHTSTGLINKLYARDLVEGLPKVDAAMDVCEDCARGKQHRSSFKTKKEISTSRPLELVHIDLCGPMRTQSLNHNKFVLVIVDDF